MAVVTIADRLYCCATCHWWQGKVGERGECTMPPSPSTVNCGRQPWDSLCEQHDFRDNAEARETAIRHYQRAQWLRRRQAIRAVAIEQDFRSHPVTGQEIIGENADGTDPDMPRWLRWRIEQ